MELSDVKSTHAREMATKAGLADHVDFKVGNAVQMIAELPAGSEAVRPGSARPPRHHERAAVRRLGHRDQPVRAVRFGTSAQ
jgi:hypothetical protein